jgi:mannose-1-phosphate guanylyltransferase
VKALVLIGGLGTRLRPITYTIPKQLIPIAGRPVLYHALDLIPGDVEEVILATGYKADVIGQYVREHPTRFPVRMVAEASPLGTGGGMRNAGDGVSDPFLLLNGDVIAHVDVPALLAFHRQRHAFGSLVLTEVEDPEPYGVAALDAGDRITHFVEKPKAAEAPSHWINAGMAIWGRDTISAIPPGTPVSFERDVLPGLLPRGVYGFRMSGFWEDAGTPERLLNAQRLLFDAGRGQRTLLPEGSTGTGPVAVGEGSEARGARFGRYVTVGSGVHIGSGAFLEDCVVMDRAIIGADANISGSIIGPGMEIAPGQRVESGVAARSPPA